MPAQVETKVIDRGEKRFKAQLMNLSGSFVDTGFFGGIKRDEGSPVSIAEYAFYNEMGARDPKRNWTLPERSFIRSVIDANGKKYQLFLNEKLMDIAFGKTTAERVLKTLGIRIEGDIKKKITELMEPPNAPSTIARKKSSNPLIDSGTMRNAVTHKVTI